MKKFDLENFPTSESAKKMLSYVSDGFYDGSYVGKWIFQVMGSEYDVAQKIVEDLPAQFFPETATWGLMYHEIKWGLPVRLNLPYEERRRLIYQKRDYRAPMTPHRMEKYLETMTGFEVHIADTSDVGEYGFVPSHPNIFKVYFLGEGTLDAKQVRSILNGLKQAHTIYALNDRIEIKVDNVQLEQIKLACAFVLYVSFWGSSQIYHGARRYNGATRYNARRNYGMRVRIKSLFELYMESDTGCSQLFLISILNCMKMNVADICQQFGVASDVLSKSRLMTYMGSVLHCDTGMQIITQRNVVRYNGTRRYNGTMKYNALYKKEEVE